MLILGVKLIYKNFNTEHGQFSDAVGVKWVSKIYYISYIYIYISI